MKSVRPTRISTGISLRRFAKRLGISASYLSRIERGLDIPTESRIRDIAAALDMDPDPIILDTGRLPLPVTESILASLRQPRGTG